LNITNTKRQKANSNETIKQQDILYSNPHTKYKSMIIHTFHQRSTFRFTSLPIFHFAALLNILSSHFKSLHFTSHIITYLTLFFKCDLQRKVISAPAGSWFQISGFHRELLQSVTFISRLNALDYTKLRSCIKILKDINLKITPTCFGSYAIHHRGV